MNKKILFFGLLIIFVIAALGYFSVEENKKTNVNYNFPMPEEVVRQYFISWNNKNYPDMYATISDGFKKIEPTANNLSSFRDYVNSQGTESVNILLIKEKSNNGMTAEVDYSVEFVLDNGRKIPFNGTFTLKNRQADIVRGWKLIHPYGENIDIS